LKLIVVILILILCLGAFSVPVTAASGVGGNNAGSAGPAGGDQGQPRDPGGISGPVETPAEPVRETIREENRAEVRQITTPPGQNITTIRRNREEMSAALRNMSSSGTQQLTNQNEVRLAVHTLLAMEDVTGGIGPQVSAIARDFNNSARETWLLEERIRNRDAFSRFFFGGDRVSAGELANLTLQNQNRIQQIEQLMNTGTLDEETRALLQEQLRIMQEENTRLKRIASTEQQNRGIFGWFG
jgi:hypothetical protein